MFRILVSGTIPKAKPEALLRTDKVKTLVKDFNLNRGWCLRLQIYGFMSQGLGHRAYGSRCKVCLNPKSM